MSIVFPVLCFKQFVYLYHLVKNCVKKKCDFYPLSLNAKSRYLLPTRTEFSVVTVKLDQVNILK